MYNCSYIGSNIVLEILPFLPLGNANPGSNWKTDAFEIEQKVKVVRSDHPDLQKFELKQ